jgi:hypothetical protein
LYQASNLGNIRSIDRVVVSSDGIRQFRHGKKIKQRKNKKGYKIVRLSKNGEAKNKFVHILVIESFCKRPDGLNQINHKDENKENNRLDNLEYCNNVYNQNYGSCRVNKSKSTINDKRKSKQVIQFTKDGTFIKEFPSVAEVSRLLGFTTSSITRCCNGSKKYSIIGGYQWKYKDSNKQILNLPMINKYSQDGTLICSYNSVTEASEDTGVHHSSICQCFTGKKKSAGGFIWKKEL